MADPAARQDIPDATVARLPHYLRALSDPAERGVALLDRDPDVVGQEIAGMTVGSVDDLERIVTERGVAIGVIATPAVAAQGVCDRFVAVGVRSVLNFAACVLSVPEGVHVRKVDLSTELQILAFREQRKTPVAQERMPLLEVAL
jgi:redox-sensing transcriptional repressor